MLAFLFYNMLRLSLHSSRMEITYQIIFSTITLISQQCVAAEGKIWRILCLYNDDIFNSWTRGWDPGEAALPEREQDIPFVWNPEVRVAEAWGENRGRVPIGSDRKEPIHGFRMGFSWHNTGGCLHQGCSWGSSFQCIIIIFMRIMHPLLSFPPGNIRLFSSLNWEFWILLRYCISSIFFFFV